MIRNTIAIDNIVDQAQRDIKSDNADLYDFFHYCRRANYDFFKGWSIERFKDWNDQRIASLGDSAPPIDPPVADIQSLANRILIHRLGLIDGFKDKVLQSLIELKNAFCEDLNGQDDQTVSETLRSEIDAYIKNQPERTGLSPLAKQAQLSLQKEGGYRE